MSDTMEFFTFVILMLYGIGQILMTGGLLQSYDSEGKFHELMDFYIYSVQEEGASLGGLLFRILCVPAGVAALLLYYAGVAIQALFSMKVIKPRNK